MFTRSKPQPALPESPATLAAAPQTPTIRDLPYLELKRLHEDIGVLLAQQEAEARQMFKADFIAKMHEYGMSLGDFKPTKAKKERKKSAVPVKYRDPDNTENSWSGRGRTPAWLQEKLDQGRAIEEFALETTS